MKKIKKYVSFLVIILALFLCVGCSEDLESSTSNIEKSMKSVKTIETVQTIEDNGILVYSFKKSITFTDGNNVKVVNTTSTLSSELTLVDEVKEETIENIDRDSLFGLNLDETLISKSSYEDNKLYVEVSKENIQKVMNDDSIKILDLAVLTFTFESKKIINITCTFKTETSKDVMISTNYGY